MTAIPRIAVVDDDPGILRSLGSLCRSAGMAVATFDSAEAFLAVDDPERFDCIVTDLHMPGQSGLELQEALIRRGSGGCTIIMTAFPTAALAERARAGGVASFLAKPVDPERLLAAIRDAIAAAPS